MALVMRFLPTIAMVVAVLAALAFAYWQGSRDKEAEIIAAELGKYVQQLEKSNEVLDSVTRSVAKVEGSIQATYSSTQQKLEELKNDDEAYRSWVNSHIPESRARLLCESGRADPRVCSEWGAAVSGDDPSGEGAVP